MLPQLLLLSTLPACKNNAERSPRSTCYFMPGTCMQCGDTLLTTLEVLMLRCKSKLSLNYCAVFCCSCECMRL